MARTVEEVLEHMDNLVSHLQGCNLDDCEVCKELRASVQAICEELKVENAQERFLDRYFKK